jgi:hypothetical protein
MSILSILRVKDWHKNIEPQQKCRGFFVHADRCVGFFMPIRKPIRASVGNQIPVSGAKGRLNGSPPCAQPSSGPMPAS